MSICIHYKTNEKYWSFVSKGLNIQNVKEKFILQTTNNKMAHCKKVFFMTMMVEVPVHFNRSMRQNEEKLLIQMLQRTETSNLQYIFICFSFMKRPHPPPPKLLNPPAWRSVRWSQRRSGTNPNPKCKGDNSLCKNLQSNKKKLYFQKKIETTKLSSLK